MPHIDRVNVASLTRLADVAGNHDRLVATAEGGFQTSGRVGAFFTAKATHRATAEAFLGAIRNKYGDGIADALAPQLSAMRQQGKPLKARVARDILAQASDMSQALGPANTEMARRFLLATTARAIPAIWTMRCRASMRRTISSPPRPCARPSSGSSTIWRPTARSCFPTRT